MARIRTLLARTPQGRAVLEKLERKAARLRKRARRARRKKP